MHGLLVAPEDPRLGLAEVPAPQEPTDVPAERPGEDGVQEGVAQGVDRVEQDEQDLGVGHGDERHTQGCRNGKEGDGCLAEEVGENEHGHALGDLGVSVVCRELGVVYVQVNADIAQADHRKGHDLEDQQSHHIELGASRLDVHGQADAHFAVTADPHQREQSHQ